MKTKCQKVSGIKLDSKGVNRAINTARVDSPPYIIYMKLLEIRKKVVVAAITMGHLLSRVKFL